MKKASRIFNAVLVGALLLLGAPFGGAAADDSATALVERTAEGMLRTLEARRGEIDANPQLIYELVGNKLAPHFDFQMITRSAVGKDWNSASSAQQGQLVSAFREMLVRTYAKALMKYSGEEIVYQSSKPGTRADTIVVPTEVRAPGAPAIPIDYRMHKLSGDWKVYDVVIDNVSLISNYRGQFRTSIGRNGIDGLIRELESKNAAGA
ncbi:MAG: ABC transporter substrate-binding protein [Thiohalocapsa sp.]|jgi:phospholipid transport system substrate-binding protein|nr:ABC transporter substrate-binding protein [Thiohalocapsa sp.]MCF7990290.1 ABC transporter substrate-binding protein [Thiohalocapsa sp.]